MLAHRVDRSLHILFRTIASQRYTICYADYWIGMKLQWVSDERIRFIPYHSFDRTKAASRALAATPGPKCYVDAFGRVSEFHPNPLDAIIQRNAREHLRRMVSFHPERSEGSMEQPP